jgi:small-conductance mechanosensitive channel
LSSEVVAPGQSNNDDSSGTSSGDTLVSEVGNEIKVTLDRWSVGQLDVGDLIVACGVILAVGLIAWLVTRIIRRIARRYDGAVRAAIATAGLVLGSSVVLVGIAVALEVLGFSLGPILVLILLVAAGLLLLRPMMTNLSSGLLLQVRGALTAGDLIATNGTIGTVKEINARSVVIDTPDGRQVHVPNADVLNEKVENFSKQGRRRSEFELMLDLDVDLDTAVGEVERCVAMAPAVLDEPAPAAHPVGIVGRFVVVRVMVWHRPSIEEQYAAVAAAVQAVGELRRTGELPVDGPDVVAPILDTVRRVG